MLPTINGKQIIDCTLEDLQVIINNADYRENEYLDYKGMFSVDQYDKSDSRQQREIAEFRSDVCSFANANGGYIIIGIKEEKGIPVDLHGIELKDDNTDNFELRLKNYLQTIMPRIPNCRFRFLELHKGRFIVLILIRHDSFSPYIYLENERDYRVYKRNGNAKTVVGYTELKNMFIQSVALEKEIDNYRKERINYFRERGKERFVLFHVIPDTFVDSTHNTLMYALDRQMGGDLYKVFQQYRCSTNAVPAVDGIFYKSYNVFDNKECRLFNNCVAEAFDALKAEIYQDDQGNNRFPRDTVWENAEGLIKDYITIMETQLHTKRVFVCMSIVGCENIMTEKSFRYLSASSIDRERLMIDPCVIDDISNDDCVAQRIKWLKLNYLLALGLTKNQELSNLLEEFKQK